MQKLDKYMVVYSFFEKKKKRRNLAYNTYSLSANLRFLLDIISLEILSGGTEYNFVSRKRMFFNLDLFFLD